MTKARKQSLMKTLHQIKADLDVHNYSHALSACNILTCVGFGVPAFSPAYWHAKSMQHALYYSQAGYHGLGKVRKQLAWITDQVRRTKVEA